MRETISACIDRNFNGSQRDELDPVPYIEELSVHRIPDESTVKNWLKTGFRQGLLFAYALKVFFHARGNFTQR